jgi:hypothetical protein
VAVDITDKDFVKFVARDSGPINVYAKDTVTGEDELKSTHTTVRKAQQKAGNLALAAAFENPAVKIRYEKHEVVDVTINAQDITMQVGAPSGVLNPLLTNYTMVAEPGSYGLSGALAGTTVAQVGDPGELVSHATFESFAVGTTGENNLVSSDGFTLGNRYSAFVDDLRGHGVGDRSCRFDFLQGEESGVTGGAWSGLNANIGESFSWRAWFYIPSGFVWNSGSKFVRPEIDGGGYMNIYPSDGNFHMQNNTNSTEFQTSFANNKDLRVAPATAPGVSSGAGVKPPYDEWFCFEMYIEFAKTPNSGIWRVWFTGTNRTDSTYYENELCFNDEVTPTVRSGGSGGYDRIQCFTQWNPPSAPQNQSLWLDDFKIVKNPTNTDINGFPFIGAFG